MTTQHDEHTNTSRELLTKADEALAQDDLFQASEKGWGAAAHMVKSVAQRNGWRHCSYRDLYQVVNQLAQESGESQVRVMFSSASALQTNFYENWMPQELVQDNLAQVRAFVEKLEELD